MIRGHAKVVGRWLESTAAGWALCCATVRRQSQEWWIILEWLMMVYIYLYHIPMNVPIIAQYMIIMYTSITIN